MSAKTLIFVRLTISVLGLPFLIYLVYKFWKLRQHFLIKARFPKITIFLSISMYIAVTEHVLAHYIVFTYDNDKTKASESNPLYPLLSSTAQIFTFLFCAVIVYRSLLIYDRWSVTQYALQNQSKIVCGHKQLLSESESESDSDPHLPIKYIYNFNCFCKQKITFYHPSLMWSVTIIFIIAFIIKAICAPSSAMNLPTLQQISWLPYLVIIIVGMVVIFKGRKIKDSVLFKRETYVIMLLIITQMFIIPFAETLGESLTFFISFMLGTIGWILILILSLLMVYQNEGSLQYKTCTNHVQLPPLNADLDVSNTVSNTSTIANVSEADNINKLHLYQYLQSLDNYNRFGEFLNGCFALENLLFFVKIIVFRHVVLDIIADCEHKLSVNTDVKIEVNSNGDEDEYLDKWCPKNRRAVFGLTFEYIDGLYESLKPKEISKSTIHNAAKHIYQQFISTEAVYQVNISGANRGSITAVFDGNDEKLNEIEEYLVVFNLAINEVYDLLRSVYKFQYKYKQT